jgi:putative nucleotidyltransferase with HDIG domain
VRLASSTPRKNDVEPRSGVRIPGPPIDTLTDPRSAELLAEAALLAAELLEADPQRYRHTLGVAARASFLTAAVEVEDAATLIAAAWLHDIGYATSLRQTGFHSIDGALYLDRLGWPAEISGLVAHHSGSRFLASALGLDSDMERYDFVANALSDALTIADQSTGPRGELMGIEQRLRDQLVRHGPDSCYAEALPQRGPYIRSCATRVVARLDADDLALGLAPSILTITMSATWSAESSQVQPRSNLVSSARYTATRRT